MDDRLKQLLLLGREHFQKQEYEKAEYLLRQVLEITDSYADVHHMVGVIAHGHGAFEEAERHFRRAVELNPNYTEAQLNLMVTYNDLGKYEAARQIYTTMRGREVQRGTLDPFAKGKIANMHAELSAAYLDVGLKLEAIRELERAVELCPTFADLRTRLAMLYRDTGDRERARAQLQAAREHNPGFTLGRVTLAAMYLGDGDPESAIGELKAVLERDPHHRSAAMYLRLAQAQLDGGAPAPEPEAADQGSSEAATASRDAEA